MKEAGTQNEATRGEAGRPSCAYGRRQVRKTGFHFWGKLKFSGTRKHWASMGEYYYTEQINDLVSERDECLAACE